MGPRSEKSPGNPNPLRGAPAREAILDASILEIERVGIDAVALQGIVGRLGLTRGAVYSRWESVDELLADVWTDRLSSRLEGLFDLGLAVACGEPHASGADFDAELDRDPAGLEPKARAREEALHDFLLASRRKDAVNETMVAAMEAWLAKPLAQRLGRDVATGVLAVVCGQVLLRRFCPSHPWRWSEFVRHFGKAAPGLREEPPFKTPEIEPRSPFLATGEPGFDALNNRLLEAAAAAISRSGLHGATVSRIGRLAGMDGTNVYQRYPSLADLFVATLRLIFAAFSGTNRHALEAILSSGAKEAGNVTAAILVRFATSSVMRDRRRLRLEGHLAGRMHDEIGRIVEESLEIPLGHETVARADDPTSESARRAIRHYQVAWMGLATLHEAIGLRIEPDRLERILALVWALRVAELKGWLGG